MGNSLPIEDNENMLCMDHDDTESSIIPFPAQRRHAAGDIMLFMYDHAEMLKDVPLTGRKTAHFVQFIYCLKGKVLFKLSSPDTHELCLTPETAASVCILEGDGFFSAYGPDHFQALVLQVKVDVITRWGERQNNTNFLSHVSMPCERQVCLRHIPFPPSQSVLVRQIMLTRDSDPLNDIFVTAKAHELFYKQLELLLAAFPLRGDVSNTENKAAQAVYEHLQNNLGSTPGLSELALAAGLSRNRLTVTFRKVFGDTVFGILRRERLRCARQLLEHDMDKNITEIAYACGFSNPGHFSRSFRSEYGLSPCKFRRKKRLERPG